MCLPWIYCLFHPARGQQSTVSSVQYILDNRVGGWPQTVWRSVGLSDTLNHREDLSDQRQRKEWLGEKNTGQGPDSGSTSLRKLFSVSLFFPGFISPRRSIVCPFIFLIKNFFLSELGLLVVHRLSLIAPKACTILVSQPGIEPESPALEGRFLTNGLPRKPLLSVF